MSQKIVKFITKNGHRIPIRAAAGIGAHGVRTGALAHRAIKAGAAGYGASLIARHGLKEPKDSPVQINKKLALASLGTAVASGIVGAATFTGGIKKVALGAFGTHLVDLAGTAANVASAKGGTAKDKARVVAKQEAVNFAVGNTVFAAGIIGSKANRKAFGEYAGSAINFARKALRVV